MENPFFDRAAPKSLDRNDFHRRAQGVESLSDEDGAACEAWGVWVEKTLYGRKYMGIERATFLVDAEGLIRRAAASSCTVIAARTA